MNTQPDTRNNFDLIRLFAAGQVVVNHVLHHLDLADTTHSAFARVFNFFPGVPIFFFVSGFLISASYARSHARPGAKRHFYTNRALRIFPGLWVCFAVSVLSVWAAGYFTVNPPPLKTFGIWVAGQVTAVQFYNPGFLRDYGVGALNGSLWTITVELQFYLMVVPLMALLWTRRRAFRAVVAVFVAINAAYALWLMPAHADALPVQLVSVTFVPWIAMFLAGLVAQHHWERIRGLFAGRFWLWLGIYAGLVALGIAIETATGLRISGNRITPLHYIPLGGLVLAAAYSRPGTAHALLRENDISYGVYIYHMPVVNLWLWMGWGRDAAGFAATLGLVVLCASLSWLLIERPALRLKKSALFRR